MVTGVSLEEVTERVCPLVDQRAGLRQWEAPHLPSLLGMYMLLIISTAGAIFTDTALGDQCVVETLWIVYVAELS